MNSFKFNLVSIILFCFFAFGCKKDNSSQDSIKARFTTPVIEHGKVTFRNYSENATDFFWEFDDGNTSSEKDPIHDYQSLGSYNVKLTASNEMESDVYLLKVVIGQIFPANLTRLDDLPFGARTQMIHFTKNGKGYIAGGLDYSDFIYQQDLWEFDPIDQSWNQLSNDVPTKLNNATSFVLNDKAYFGFGNSNFGNGNLSFYSYDFQSTSFLLEGEFPGNQNNTGTIIDAVGFSYEEFGYLVGRGQNDFTGKRMWKFDPSVQSWTEFGNYPCEGNSGMFHFIIDDKLYIGLGNENSYSFYENKGDIWEFDLTNQTWSQKNDFPGTPRRDGISFTYNGKGYFGFGLEGDPATGISTSFSDLWEYDTTSDSWQKILDMPVPNKQELFAFLIDSSLYFGGGNNGLAFSTSEFYVLDLN